jgi:hypothetical protein
VRRILWICSTIMGRATLDLVVKSTIAPKNDSLATSRN